MSICLYACVNASTNTYTHTLHTHSLAIMCMTFARYHVNITSCHANQEKVYGIQGEAAKSPMRDSIYVYIHTYIHANRHAHQCEHLFRHVYLRACVCLCLCMHVLVHYLFVYVSELSGKLVRCTYLCLCWRI